MNNGRGERLERVLGSLLYVGSIASTMLLAIGLLLSFGNAESRSSAIFLNAGLVVLMATPAARVVVSVFEYWVGRDWTFVALTTGVLIVLMGSLALALVG